VRYSQMKVAFVKALIYIVLLDNIRHDSVGISFREKRWSDRSCNVDSTMYIIYAFLWSSNERIKCKLLQVFLFRVQHPSWNDFEELYYRAFISRNESFICSEVSVYGQQKLISAKVLTCVNYRGSRLRGN